MFEEHGRTHVHLRWVVHRERIHGLRSRSQIVEILYAMDATGVQTQRKIRHRSQWIEQSLSNVVQSSVENHQRFGLRFQMSRQRPRDIAQQNGLPSHHVFRTESILWTRFRREWIGHFWSKLFGSRLRIGTRGSRSKNQSIRFYGQSILSGHLFLPFTGTLFILKFKSFKK